MTEDVAALMLTVPNTLGIFESQILEIARIIHARGGYLYCDGANFNSFVGLAKPGLMGIDVIHMNLHKTFSTPHGGGGPGSGPVAVAEKLAPFLPSPTVERRPDGTFRLDYDRPDSIGRLRTFLGNYGMFVRALAYIWAYGEQDRRGRPRRGPERQLHPRRPDRRLSSEVRRPFHARGRLLRQEAGRAWSPRRRHRQAPDGLRIPSADDLLPAHRARCSDDRAHGDGGETGAGRFHRRDARRSPGKPQENPDILLKAPHTTPVKRVDEVAAAKNLILRWRPQDGKRGS